MSNKWILDRWYVEYMNVKKLSAIIWIWFKSLAKKVFIMQNILLLSFITKKLSYSGLITNYWLQEVEFEAL